MTELATMGVNVLDWIKVNWMLVLFLTLIAGAFIFLRSKPSDIQTAAELDGILTDGQPTVVEFYSNF